MIDESSQVVRHFHFLKFFTSERDSNWLAAKNAYHWSMGNYYSQCEVDMGIHFVLGQHLIIARVEEDVHLKNVIPPYCLET